MTGGLSLSTTKHEKDTHHTVGRLDGVRYGESRRR